MSQIYMRKYLFMFVYLANEPSSTLTFGSITKQIKFKYNDVLVKKLMSMRLNLSKNNIMDYLSTSIKIYLYMLGSYLICNWLIL